MSEYVNENVSMFSKLTIVSFIALISKQGHMLYHICKLRK